MGFLKKTAEKIKGFMSITRTIKRGTEDVFFRRRRIRIVVLGSKESGKTVFLTALASNLLNHRKGNGFDLGEWEAYLEEGFAHTADEGIKDFPYPQYRNGFVKEKPEWPAKTTTTMSVLRLPLQFRKEGVKERDLLIELLDIPGERVADLTMADRSYREWCEWMTDKFGGRFSATRGYADYLEKARDCRDRDALLRLYKAYLLDEYKSMSPWLMPSVVKLTMEGKATEFAKDLDIRPLGISAEDQFVPVPLEWFNSSGENKALVKAFEIAYNKYKKAVIAPVSNWLSEADSLVYLVDVLNILKRGKVAYNHERKVAEAVLGLFVQHKTYVPGGALWDYMKSMVKTRIKDAYLVVTKKDLASGETSENLRRLADGLLGKEFCGLMSGLRFDKNIRTCAAVDTVMARRDDAGAEYYCARTTCGGKEEPYEPVRVPSDWPAADWQHRIDDGEFWFEDTYPVFDERENSSPPQSGLDDLVKSLLSKELT